MQRQAGDMLAYLAALPRKLDWCAQLASLVLPHQVPALPQLPPVLAPPPCCPQVLPVSDTSVRGAEPHWRDSYPYSSLCVFALHPLYLRLQALAGGAQAAGAGACGGYAVGFFQVFVQVVAGRKAGEGWASLQILRITVLQPERVCILPGTCCPSRRRAASGHCGGD